MPATNRSESLRPIADRSEKARNFLFCERAIKAERSKSSTPVPDWQAEVLFHAVVFGGERVGPVVRFRMRRVGDQLNRNQDKGGIQGSLHYAMDGETVHCFGRDDVCCWSQRRTGNNKSKYRYRRVRLPATLPQRPPWLPAGSPSCWYPSGPRWLRRTVRRWSWRGCGTCPGASSCRLSGRTCGCARRAPR